MELGAPFQFAPKEKFVWRCEEVVVTDTADGPLHRYTFHVYVFGVMLRSLIAMVDHEAQKIVWCSHGN